MTPAPGARQMRKRQSPLPASATATVDGRKAPKARKLNAVDAMDNTDSVLHARFERAASALKPLMPKGSLLPCREGERGRIADHLRSGVMQGGSTKVLYISGMPGTGKTAIFLEVLQQMRAESMKFRLVHCNAMRLGAPVQIFREIADQLLRKSANNHQACDNVTEYFSQQKPDDPVVVLLIDEVDCLMTINQAILYRVFDWLGLPKARLVLATISNTMDLPERLLPRVASRFHIERVDFEPYDRPQLHQILCTRLKAHGAVDAFNDVVLRFCAARVAAASGDVRKALQICRRAVQIALLTPNRPPEPVKIQELQEAEKELLFANPVTQAILNLSSVSRHFLAAIVLELRQKEDAEAVLLRKVTSRFQKLLAACAMESDRASMGNDSAAGDGAPDDDEVEEKAVCLTARLEAMGILSKQVPGPLEFQAVCLGSLDVEDLSCALLKVEEDPTIVEFLESGSPNLPPQKTVKATSKNLD